VTAESTTPDHVRDAIEATDYPALQRIIDGHCAAREWSALERLRVLCDHAVERGKQLWGVEEHIRYRLALHAPGKIAGGVVSEGPARFTLGPLTEVAASTHTWNELADHLVDGPWRAGVAHERAVRGEDLSDIHLVPDLYEMPLALQSWEPSYRLAEYRSDRVEQHAPDPVQFRPAPSSTPPTEALEEPEATEALRALTSAWVDQSSGRCETLGVVGDAVGAIAALGARSVSLANIPPAEALRWMAWAGSVGGVHGRRRGAAAGRFAAWWAAAQLAACDWPVDPGDLGRAIDELRWFLWSDGSTGGWRLQLAVEDPENGVAWATSAIDQDPDAPPP
jgi:hypothetical protein